MAHSTRPTLPPLHSLGLPRGDIPPRIHESHDMNELSSRPPKPPHFPLIQPCCHQRPQPPPAASQKPPSPSPCLRPCTNTPPATSKIPFLTRKIRLSPTSFENADAVVLISPPVTPNTPPPKPLLLVGPALQRLRRRQRQLVKGTRLHPYRVVRGPSDPRPPTEPPCTMKA